ncbi:hypothetical protein RchiOBHm_Chr6g0272041 [Rosa chinensis]|uniref:TOD1/MUCI70 glycosyltransferase-like domain-containing protein n=1 Tax=Rosa chinensis TaxID=74649 RepID=A0A2P6PR30_ROSCH|nr:uncharacterized protein LOC112170456 [Rosa chinensis]PRQ24403.1 hypothetical protein RchiOBHm_Chr6g0272041 [Rosa chinensis]
MAQYRQSGMETRLGLRGGNGGDGPDHVAIGIRTGLHKPGRTRRSGRSPPRISTCALVLVLSLVLLFTVAAYFYLSLSTTTPTGAEINSNRAQEDDSRNDSDFLTNVTRTETSKVLKFGKGSVTHGRDSRYWDKDDRRRDEDYNEDVVQHGGAGVDDESTRATQVKNSKNKSENDEFLNSSNKRAGLYNEAGRKELKIYEAEYEASLKNNRQSNDGYLETRNDVIDADDEYDDGIDSRETHTEEYDDTRHQNGDHFSEEKLHDEGGRESIDLPDAGINYENVSKKVDKVSTNSFNEHSAQYSRNLDEVNTNSRHVGVISSHSSRKSHSESKRKAKRHKFSGSSCEMKFLNSTAQLIEPLESRKFARFSLQYTEIEDKPEGEEQWEPRFAGHQTLQERENSFLARDQKINCGFVKGPKGSPSTGFDLSEDDANYISRCHIAVISCIFGNSDRLRTPYGKMVSRLSRKNVCFVMFIDEVTLRTLSSEGQTLDSIGFIGLWKIVVVKNLPYTDMRRVGKIPKLLPHRLFPSARYSIWLDSKLRLQLDPLLILEYFLWRKGHEYAISNHYDRHCVWEEVAQNKKLNKYNHTIIDQQFAFYQDDGLTRFNALDPNKLLPSNVPEGSFIIRAHTPMSNLFSCLWFNEVERFTPRDQLSFAYTYQKLRRMNPEKPFRLHMFKDCERRAIAKLFRHRSQEKSSTRQRATE